MDLALMNAAAILYVADKVDSLKEGVSVARRCIEDGSAQKQLELIVKYSNC